jgi:hypothetical protein
MNNAQTHIPCIRVLVQSKKIVNIKINGFIADCECQTFSTKILSKRSATCREKYTIEIIEGWILPSDND